MKQRVGPYQPAEELETGPNGSIWRVATAPDQPPLAIWNFPWWRNEYTLRAHLTRVEPVLKALDCPGLPRFLDVYIEPDECFIVMEYVFGPRLQELVQGKDARPLQPRRAARLIADTCIALESLEHFCEPQTGRSLGWRQGSFTAASVRVVGQQAKLVELCLPSANQEASGPILINPPLFAPEMVLTNSVDTRADVFVLGGLLYELLTTRVPFQAENILVMIRRLLQEDPLPPHQINREVPPALSNIVLHTLRRNPAERPPTSGALGRELESWLQGSQRTYQLFEPRDALDRIRDKLYHHDLVSVALLLEERHDFSQVPLITDYIWDYLHEELLDQLCKARPLPALYFQLLRRLPPAIPAMVSMVQDETLPLETRANAAHLLGLLGSPEAAQPLWTLAHTTQGWLQYEACIALARLIVSSPPRPALLGNQQILWRREEQTWVLNPGEQMILGRNHNAHIRSSDLQPHHATAYNFGDGRMLLRMVEGPLERDGMRVSHALLQLSRGTTPCRLGGMELQPMPDEIQVHTLDLPDSSHVDLTSLELLTTTKVQ